LDSRKKMYGSPSKQGKSSGSSGINNPNFVWTHWHKSNISWRLAVWYVAIWASPHVSAFSLSFQACIEEEMNRHWKYPAQLQVPSRRTRQGHSPSPCKDHCLGLRTLVSS
jgi:hypothetical protein